MNKKTVVATGFFAVIILAAGMLFAAASFTGTWSTAWGPLTMTQTEDKVVGSYGGSAPGRLNGIVKDNKLFYNWIGNNGEKGRGVFYLSADGNSFTGTWGSGASATSGGAWNGKRIK
ncbi:MAG: hypothetical protein KA369_23165 [Spirochaetes bacterium]|nr:hypothetical protein [Spirochaetota bacterium]